MTAVTFDRILEAARADAKRFDAEYDTWEFSSAVDAIQWAPEWADNRDAPKGGIAYADWNDIGGYGDRNPYSKRARTLLKRVGDLLEQIGCELDWSDQVSTCDGCGKLIQTSPDCYSWQPEFVVGDGDITCAVCLADAGESYLEGLEGNERESCICTVDPSDYGYVKVADELERGFHPGQDADPRVIAKALRAKGVSRFLFQVDSVGQFDASFSVWIHESESKKVSELSRDETDGPSVSEAMKRGLEAAAKQSAALQGEGVRYSQINEDGTATTRLISREDFISKGIKP